MCVCGARELRSEQRIEEEGRKGFIEKSLLPLLLRFNNHEPHQMVWCTPSCSWYCRIYPFDLYLLSESPHAHGLMRVGKGRQE